jgi:hypothetical protein
MPKYQLRSTGEIVEATQFGPGTTGDRVSAFVEGSSGKKRCNPGDYVIIDENKRGAVDVVAQASFEARYDLVPDLPL